MEEQNLNVRILPLKEYLPKLMTAAIVVLILLLAVLIVSEIVGVANGIKEGKYIGQGGQYRNAITVSGEGKVLGKPDIAQVDLGVVTDADTVANAQKQNSDKIDKIIQAMKSLGIADEDMQTSNYTIFPRTQYINGVSDIIGYEVNQTLRVKIRNLEKVGQVLAQTATAGVNQVGALNFTFDNPENLQAQARQKAIDDAKSKAQSLANALGVQLGKIVSFSENISGGPTPLYTNAGIGGAGGGGAAPTIQAGQNEVIIDVSLNYEIY